MKKLLGISLVATVASPAMAVVYTDLLNDVNAPMSGYGNPNVDLASLEITNTLSDISFKFTTNSPSITSPDWIKLNVIMRKGGGPLDMSANGNGWNRPYNLDGGADRHIGGWVDSGGGFESRTYNGSGWDLQGATYNSTPGMSVLISGDSVTYTLGLGTLGLAVGDSFTFDALTTGGGNDGAWDLLSQGPTTSNPGDPYTSMSQLNYEVVPEPASMTALAVGALAMLRRRKK